MSAVGSVVALAVGWLLVTARFTLENMLLGLLVAALVLHLLRRRDATSAALSRLWRIIALAGLFLKELLLSAIGVAVLVLTPKLERRLRPAIVAFPLTASSDAEITLLANLITLTPGTLSLDVSADRTRLYVHVLLLADRDALIADIADGFEKKVIDVFR